MQDESLNSSSEHLVSEGSYNPPSLPGVIPLNHSYPNVGQQTFERQVVYAPSYPVLE
jgi:hypothetical protein